MNLTFQIKVSNPGVDIGGLDVQQDHGFHFIINDSQNMSCHVIGVFDGHGQGGEQISRESAQTMSESITKPGFYDLLRDSPQQVAEILFSKAQEHAFSIVLERIRNCKHEVVDGSIKIKDTTLIRGGTTATIIFAHQDGTIITLSVGDSDAWLYTPDATKISAEHTPLCEDEYNRISAKHPETKFKYHKYHGMHALYYGDDIYPHKKGGYYHKNVDGVFATSLMVEYGGDTHSLAMTRSIGDEIFKAHGVISTPSVSVHKVEEPCVIQVASDGYWDNIVTKNQSAKVATAVKLHGYDAIKIMDDWFGEVESESRVNFGSSRDNMWGYVITLN